MKTRIKNFFPSLPFTSPLSRLPLSYLLLSFLTFFLASVASAQIPTNGLVGYWPFNGNANDESGNGNNGTVNGATLTTDRFGNANSAYSFDGVNDFIEVPVQQNSIIAYSISCWFKYAPGANNENYKGLVQASGAYPNAQYSFNLQISASPLFPNQANHKVSASINGPGVYNGWISNNTYNDNTWHSLVGVFEVSPGAQTNSGNILLYLDGVLISSNAFQVNYGSITAPVTGQGNTRFGMLNHVFPERYFDGILDDISIYNRALTPTEITQIYTDQTSTVATPPCPTLATNLQTGLVGYWPFCGNANDESGNGNNGTVNGATLTTDRFGNANSAYSFDGNDKIGLPLINLSNSNEMSMDIWVFPTSYYTGVWWEQDLIRQQGNGNPDYLLGFQEHGGQISFGLGFQNGFYSELDVAVNGNSLLNSWHHIAATFSGNEKKLFLDGQLIGTELITGNSGTNISFNPTNGDNAIGAISSGDYIAGKLDEAKLYSRALSPTEITQLYTDASVALPVVCTPFLGEDQTVCVGTSVTLNASTSSLACPTLPSNLQTGLVGYWPFCGNANDESGNGNNGTVNGASLTTDRFGNANSAYAFDGSPDRIELGQNVGTALGSPNTSWSCSAWINRNNYNGVIAISDYQGVGGNDNFVAINLQVDQTVANAGIRSGTFDYNVTGGNITANQWHLISFTVSSNGLMKLYVDGQFVTSTAINSTLNFYDNPVYRIGANNYMGTYNAGTGLIDDVTVYNRALSASEIQQLYTLGQSTYLWSTGATTSSINVTPTTTTTYTCTVTDANGNACTDSVTIFVPQIEATDLSICAGESTTLSVSGVNTAITPSACPTLPANLQSGLVGYWPFCGNANDASGNGNNGTVNGATLTTDRFGNANSAYAFDGVDDGINTLLQQNDILQYTISSWFKTTWGGVIVAGHGAQPGITLHVHNDLSSIPESGKIMFAADGISLQIGKYTNQTFKDNLWHHAVGVFSAIPGALNMEQFTIYLDGNLASQFGVTAYSSNAPIANNTNIRFGNHQLWPNGMGNFNGKLDDLAIYNRALSASEIQQLYTLGQTTYLWSNGATTPTINVSPTVTTTYTCTVTTNGVSCTDSVTVVVNNPTIDLGADVTVCGTSTTLTAPSGYDSYAWSNGATSSTTTVTSNGTYTCTVTQGGCSASDAVDVTLVDATITANNSTICAGQSVTLSVPQGGSTSTACAALPTNLQTGLVGYWPFCGNANDASGNGNNGTVNGATLTTDRFGNANSAYAFDGNDWIESLITQTLGYTVSGWVFLNTNSNYNGFVQHKNNCGRGGGYIFAIPNGGDIRLLRQNCGECGNNCGAEFSISNFANAGIGEWKHLVATCDAINSHKVYVNGQLVYTQTNSSTIGQYGQQLFSIGKHHDSPDLYFLNGKADDFLLYNRALSLQEIQQLYTLGQTTYLWSNGATTSTINVSPTVTTTYTCTVTTNGVLCTDDITIVVDTPTATITPATATTFCQGGSVVLNANTGTGLSYQWRLNGTNISGATSSSYTANASGSYTVVVTNASTCSATSTGTVVTVNTLPTATITPATATTFCQGGSVVLNANTGTGLSFQWYNNASAISGATSASYTANASGSYIVVVTNASACSATSTATVVTVNALPTATNTPATATTFCQGGSVVLNANTGTGLSYQWYNNATAISGATTSSYTASASGSYTVVVTNSSTCSATSTATVVTVNALPTSTVTPATATTFCQGGSVVLNANTGTGLSFQWYNNASAISGATSASYTANASGSYTVVVTNASACSSTSTATVVTVNALPTATVTPATATTFCQGGSVVLNANTGTGLTYQWRLNGTNITGATSASYTANASGSYTVVVTNASSCSSTSTATVVTVNALPTATVTPATATTFCQGGSVVLNANTGTGLTYQWRLNGTNISGATTSSYTANASGSYTVVVTNASTCSATSTATVVTVNALPTATITPATATTFCQGGSVVLNANTGTGLTYQWYNNASAISGATSSSYTATASGSYTVVVSNASTCSSTSTATVVTVNALPTATITPATATTFCQGGSVVLNANTGTGLTYQWRLNGTNISGATSSSYTANASGSYTVVVTNASACSATSTATVVTVNALPTATITPATATTFCQGGSVVLNANTGTGLSYQWYNNASAISGVTSSSYTANASGSYTVVVTNASACSATSTATVVTVNALPTATVTPATATTFCQGGSVVLNANTGTGLTYQWRLNGTNITGATSASYTANASGSYTVVVTNASACSSTSTATVVTVNALPTATVTPATATTFCQGGSVVLNANTGTGLSYQWYNNASAISGATTSSYTANASGSYTVVVTNASTCSATSTATVVTVNALPTATVTPATVTTFCQGGSVVLNANTGTGLSYQWRLNGTNITGATTSSYTANASGSYTVVVTNASSCSATSTATVVTVNALPTATITPATATTFCQGGSVVLNANTGTGLSYQWYNNASAISGATSASYTANASGSYTVVVTNASACSSTSTATVVTVNALPTATITPATATTFCQGGSVVLNANTGTGLSYQWRLNGTNISGATTSSYTANSSGSYTVVVTNANACSSTSTATIVTVNALPTATITPATATTFCQGGSVVLNANTGAGLTYQWYNNASAISGATASSYTANASGSYTVVVTNTSTCSSTSAATVVTVNALPTATITPATATTFCQGGSVVLNANTGTGLSYQWYNNATAISGATTSSYTANASGSYTVVVTNVSACSSTSTATIVTVNALPTATITPATTTTFCQGGSVVLNANTGTGLSYQWRLNGTNITGATSSSYTANASGSYTVVVTNASTCSTTSSSIDVTTIPNIDFYADVDGDGFGDPAIILSTCVQPQGYVTNNSDCKDNEAAIYPGAQEICNDIDDDCNDLIDDGLVFTTYYADVDGDTFGDVNNALEACLMPDGYVTNSSDCNDNNANQNAASAEICNGEDDDCDGQIDNGLVFLDYYSDLDSDGFGAGIATNSCVDLGAGYVTNNADCNNANPLINPNATEVCNSIDDNCDGQIDEGIVFTTYYQDFDNDGFGTGTPVTSCTNPGAGWVTNNTDCDDTNGNTYPGATEICNTIDDNCDGQTDEGVQTVYFIDSDGDTYGNPSVSILACTQPAGYTTDDTDCNDTNANINPGAEDIAGNGIDENCDGQIDNSIFELETIIALYPNPTRTELNIQVGSALIGEQLYMFDAVGKLVYKQQLLTTQTTLNVSNFADGNYVVKVGEVVKRFVVEK